MVYLLLCVALVVLLCAHNVSAAVGSNLLAQDPTSRNVLAGNHVPPVPAQAHEPALVGLRSPAASSIPTTLGPESATPAGSWSPASSMRTARSEHTATLLPSGKVLVAGGTNLDSSNPASAELYDPVANSWSSAGSMSAARAAHTATLLPSGKVLVAGATKVSPC